MRRSVWIIPLCAVLVLVATGEEAPSVSVRGHRLGETVVEFSQRFGCARLLGLSQKEAKRERAVGDVAECRILSHPPAERFTVSLSRITDDLLSDRADVGDQISFRNGVAVAITVAAPTWSTLLVDIVERYGKPSRTSEQPRQNYVAAWFTLHSAIWELPTGVTIVAVEEFSPRLPLAKATLFAPGEAKKSAKANSLD